MDKYARLIARCLRTLDHGLELLLSTTQHAAARHTQPKRFLLAQRLLLRTLLASLNPIQPWLLNATHRAYAKLLAVYFQGLLEILDRERVSRDRRNRTLGSDSAQPFLVLSMDYLRIVFKDTPEVIQLVECLVSVSAFEESLVPFPEPIVQERGGFFMRCCKVYELTCPLDAALFAVMTRLQKEDLYPIVVKKVHDNIAVLKFVLAIIVKAIEYHEEPDVILHKIDEVWKDLYNLCLNVLYQWLISLDGNEMQRVFGALLRKFLDFNEQLPQLINQLREDVASGIGIEAVPHNSNGSGSGSTSRKRQRNA